MLDNAIGAFLGAATGDALGWPCEGYDVSPPAPDKAKAFFPWVRPIERWGASGYETIAAGSYSDDTQLILAGARCLLNGRAWPKQLAYQELPFWLLYKRGPGYATTQSARSWARGTPPWAEERELRELLDYFDAGGNGVAMRILPHCLLPSESDDFTPVACAIFSNGVITHGHPVALVGALLYGYLVWQVFCTPETLAERSLIELAIEGKEAWSELPAIEETWPEWRKSAEKATSGRYEARWKGTVEEVLEQLTECKEALGKDDPPGDDAVLEAIGAFGDKGGAGTISAVAACFMAERYKASPLQGLVNCATKEGLDTDTIASMMGGLLGALKGRDWLGPLAEQVQDAPYLADLAERLVTRRPLQDSTDEAPFKKVGKRELEAFRKTLRSSEPGEAVALPDGRRAKVLPHPLEDLDAESKLEGWCLKTEDGQSLYIIL